MRKIDLPSYNVRTVIECFNGRIEDQDIQQRILATIDLLCEAERAYQERGEAEQLYQIEEANRIGTVSIEEMKDMYSRFSRKNGATRHIYDAIKLLSPGNICPLCCQRTVSTLDHYLSKSRHAALTVTPVNLVPACKDCNTDTNARRPTQHEEQSLHPYFDSVDDEVWLVAELQQTTPPSALFSVAKPDSWPEEKYRRVKHHFDTFGLGLLYSTHAAGEIVTHSPAARRLFNSGGADHVKTYFEELAQDRRLRMRNTWQAALCQCLADSTWYCSGGFVNALPE